MTQLEQIVAGGFGKFIKEDEYFILSMPIGYRDIHGKTMTSLVVRAFRKLKEEELI